MNIHIYSLIPYAPSLAAPSEASFDAYCSGAGFELLFAHLATLKRRAALSRLVATPSFELHARRATGAYIYIHIARAAPQVH